MPQQISEAGTASKHHRETQEPCTETWVPTKVTHLHTKQNKKNKKPRASTDLISKHSETVKMQKLRVSQRGKFISSRYVDACQHQSYDFLAC